MSANDCGAPGGGAKIGAVDAWIRLPPCAARSRSAGSFMPAPAMAATATLRAGQGADDECGLIDGHV